MVEDGALDGIPVQEGSLFIQGLKNMTWLKHEHRTHQHLVKGLFSVFFFFISYQWTVESSTFTLYLGFLSSIILVMKHTQVNPSKTGFFCSIHISSKTNTNPDLAYTRIPPLGTRCIISTSTSDWSIVCPNCDWSVWLPWFSWFYNSH